MKVWHLDVNAASSFTASWIVLIDPLLLVLASEIIRALANTREKVTLIVEKVKVRAGGICTAQRPAIILGPRALVITVSETQPLLCPAGLISQFQLQRMGQHGSLPSWKPFVVTKNGALQIYLPAHRIHVSRIQCFGQRLLWLHLQITGFHIQSKNFVTFPGSNSSELIEHKRPPAQEAEYLLGETPLPPFTASKEERSPTVAYSTVLAP